MKKRNSDIFFRVILFLGISLFGLNAIAQEPKFEARVSSDNVLQNSIFEVQFELSNANGENFQPPEFTGLKVIGGPAMGSSTVIVNGAVSRSMSWTYSLMAQREGKVTIGPASVMAGHRKLTSNPVSFLVLKAEDLAGRSTGDVSSLKLIAYVKPGDYYPGQQIILEYRLLYNENVQTANTITEDDYSGFFIQNFNSFSKEATMEEINGVRFANRILKAIALFAHQSGTYVIDPMVMDIGINAPYPVNQGFFTMRRLRNVQVATDPATIKIIPLPADVSDIEFSGAVGKYSISLAPLNNTNISTDNDLKLLVEFTGDGDSRRWDPPKVHTNGEFELFDPVIKEDQMIDTRGALLNRRVIEYTLIPKLPGNYEVHIPFRFFNPETRQYETIQTDTIQLHVTQGNNRRIVTNADSLQTQFEIRKVRNITTDDRFWSSPVHLMLFGLFLALTSYGGLIAYRRKKLSRLSPDDQQRSVALRNARTELESLHLVGGDKTFAEKITAIYTRFLEARLSIPPSALDQEKLPGFLMKSAVPADISQQALALFNDFLSLRYGGIVSVENKSELINRSKAVMDDIDRTALRHI